MPFRQISPQAKARLAGLRILVAEDEPVVSMEIEDVIVENGAQFVGPYGTLEDLLDALQRERYDLAILDLRLGRSDALPAAERLNRARVPFVFHSGDADPARLTAAFPGAPLCKKPCAPERLLEAAAHALERAKAG